MADRLEYVVWSSGGHTVEISEFMRVFFLYVGL